MADFRIKFNWKKTIESHIPKSWRSYRKSPSPNNDSKQFEYGLKTDEPSQEEVLYAA